MYPPGSIGEAREQAERDLWEAIQRAERGINAHWLTRWTYRLVRIRNWRPW